MATLRMSGLVSGMDVDSVVKQMMTVKRAPLDKLTQQKQTMGWQRENYREINSKLIDFKTNKLTAYQKSAAMNTQTAVVSENTTSIKAEATADANGIPMSIKVKQLAIPATARMAGAKMSNPDGTRLTSSSTLENLQKLNTGTKASDDYTITINNKSITLSKDLTIKDAISKINNSDANVTAKFDEITGELSIQSKTFSKTGTLSLGAEDTFQKLFGGLSGSIKPYQSAVVEITGDNGTPTEMTYATNSLKLNGISITLLSESTTAAKITTTSDSTKAIETIKNFVSDYNTLLSALTVKVNEDRYTDFAPLTDDQRKEMTETQIETWEAKAKSGLLKNDEILKSTISDIRNALTEKLGQLSAYGITTGSYYENGKLYIDEDKLKKALTDRPQEVMSAFQGGGSSSIGLFDKLSNGMNNAIEKMSTKAGTSKFSSDITVAFKSDSLMGKELTDYTKRISSLQSRLDDYEDNLYKKFTAMETALSRYNSQSSSLASYMSS